MFLQDWTANEIATYNLANYLSCFVAPGCCSGGGESAEKEEAALTEEHPNGYLAVPKSGQGPGVLVLHAWWGLNETTRAYCDRLANSGFVVFAPDLYHGQVTDDIAEAEKLARSLDSEADVARTEIQRAAEFLVERSKLSDGRLAVIGFSLGAFYALDVSARLPETVSSVVVYYGTGPADFSTSRAVYLGHFAENDPYEPSENVQWVKSSLSDRGRSFTFHIYPGTGHWFAESDRADAHNQAAAELAWERTLAFLKRTEN